MNRTLKFLCRLKRSRLSLPLFNLQFMHNVQRLVLKRQRILVHFHAEIRIDKLGILLNFNDTAILLHTHIRKRNTSADCSCQLITNWGPIHVTEIFFFSFPSGADLLAVNADGNMPYDICEDDSTLDLIESEMASRGGFSIYFNLDWIIFSKTVTLFQRHQGQVSVYQDKSCFIIRLLRNLGIQSAALDY